MTQTRNPLSIQDLMNIERLSNIAISPDGRRVLVSARKVSLEKNETDVTSYLIDVESGSRLPYKVQDKGVSNAVWTKDGKKLFYICEKQLWMSNGDGTEPVCLTDGKNAPQTPVPDAEGRRVLFSKRVFTDPELEKCNAESKDPLPLSKIYGLQNPNANARVIDNDGSFYRHWDEWCDRQRTHLFVLDVETGAMCDLTPGEVDCPPIALGSAKDYDFSPDGSEVAFVLNPDKVIPRSTNNSVYRLKLDGIKPVGKAERISITDANDTHPRYIDNDNIAYLGMDEPGYESDYNRIRIYNIKTRQTRTYLEDFERTPDAFAVYEPGKLLFLAQDFAHVSLFTLRLSDGKIERLTCGSSYTSFASAGHHVIAVLQKLNMPAECVALEDLHPVGLQLENGVPEVHSAEKVRFLTQFSDILSNVEMNPGKSIWFTAQDGEKMEGYIVLPPKFDASKRYPMILLIHGGPQGAFLDSFHYRWNVEMFAAQGAVTVFCNPRGSTGYERKITREISNDWSGKCPSDIMCFVDAVLKECPFIDADRMAAAGASFGGYMINWLAGHTDRFRAFVSHDGIFNTEMSAYTTEELWFSEKEFGGVPYKRSAEMLKHSPHRFIENFNTPTLVVQGEQDFRCYTCEGISLFTALLYKGVPSRLVYFPDECHWVQQPANAQQWYYEVLAWLYRYIAA